MTQFIVFGFMFCSMTAFAIAYILHIIYLNNFIKNLQSETEVKYHIGPVTHTAIVERIPGKRFLLVKSIDNERYYFTSVENIFPL